MNRQTTLIAVFCSGLIAGVSVSLLVAPAPAAQAQANSSCPWPESLDAVRAAPANHRVLLENEAVRVLDVTVAPGKQEPIHAHCLPSVLVVLGGGRAQDYDQNGKLLDEGTVIPEGAKAPFAFWLEHTPPHSVHNIDAVPIHLVRVEVKAVTSSGARSSR
jgi:quercetin dioxygenase-like cupin family protein